MRNTVQHNQVHLLLLIVRYNVNVHGKAKHLAYHNYLIQHSTFIVINAALKLMLWMFFEFLVHTPVFLVQIHSI